MNKKRRLYSIVSAAVILAFLYQAASFIPFNFSFLNLSFISPNGAAATVKRKVELSDKRTERSKTFLNPSGSLTTEVSQEPINYKDKEGKIKPIDTSLVQDLDGFKVTENSLALDFNSSTDNLFTIKADNGSSILNYKVLDSVQSSIQPVKTKDNQLSYLNYKTGADLTYKVLGGRLKEEIVLNKPPDDNTFTFEIDLENLKPVQQKDGSIKLVDDNGNTSLAIEKPYMTDANKDDVFVSPDTFTSYRVDMDLQPIGGSNYILKLRADTEWLNASERKYPVKIDPTFSVPNTSTEDTYIRSTAENSAYGTEERVYVGGWSEIDQTKALLKFELSSIPNNADITNATLSLTSIQNTESNINAGQYNTGLTQTRLYKATSTWNEGTTFNSQPSYTGPIDQKPDDNPTFSVTSTVRDWAAGAANNGFVIDNTSEVKLIDDSSPGGTAYQTPSPWWLSTYPVHSGSVSHKENNASGTHQHKYSLSPYTFFIPGNSWIRTWVYLSPNYPPSEIMLQYMVNGDWSHRAYWGSNSINYGTNGTASRYYIGSSPGTGSWQKLNVRADYVGLNNQEINGAAFTLYNGQAYFDEVQNWRTQNFYTKEATVDADLKPKLSATYNLNPLGREDYKTYKVSNLRYCKKFKYFCVSLY